LGKAVCPSNSYRNTAQSTLCDLTDWTFGKKKIGIFLHVASII